MNAFFMAGLWFAVQLFEGDERDLECEIREMHEILGEGVRILG
jgi:hypothetical protein